MKNLAKIAISAIAAMSLLATATPALAATPYLSVNREGNGDLVRLTVSNADPNAQIYLYRRQGSVSWTSLNIGYTNGNGSFDALMSLGGDGSGTAVEQYVTVNGQQSYPPISTYSYSNGGCTYNCGNNGSLNLSQTSVTVSAGQSTTVQAYNNYGGSVYINSISNSNVVSASVSGSTITLQGINNGSANVNVCVNNNNQCAIIYVTVNGYQGGTLSLSPSSLSMQVGQSTTVYVQNISGSSVYVSNNTNTSVVSTSISGSSVVVAANNPGFTQLTVCANNYGQCATLPVTVTGYNYGTISFSQNSINLTSNQSSNITIYSNGNNNNYNNNYTISSNSNSSVVSASITGNTLYLYAQGTWGTSTLTVCQTGNGSSCGTVTVTVNGYNGGNNNCSTYGSYNCGTLTITTTSLPAMTLGQYYSYQLQASGGSSPYYYSVTSGSLPAGMTLSTTGQLYGTPQYGSTMNFTVRVTDSYGRSGTTSVYLNGNGSVLGSSTYNNGQLINENGTVYIVYKNTKTAFSSASVFRGLGFSFDRVVNTGYTSLGISGYTVTTASASHPWGAWVKNGSTVYFVHELGLIPVPDYNTFINNGGQDNLVVQANSWDFQRTILSTMTWGDARLR